MTLIEQLQEIYGRPMVVIYLEDILKEHGGTPKEALALLERNSRVVPIREYLARKISTRGPLFIVARDCRDGILVQLLEGLANQS